MANSNGWGDGASNNDIGWGQGADNAIGWGSIYANSWAGATDIVGTPAVDPDAQAFITAASITDPTQQSAINQLVVDLKGYGIWTKMKALYPFVGGTAAQHKWNLKDPRDLDAAFRLVFSGGGTHSVNGYQTNGVNAFAETYYNPFNNLTDINSNHISIYSRTNNQIGIDMGGGVGSVVVDLELRDNYMWNMASNLFHTNNNSQGHFINTRTASNLYKFIKNGSTVIGSSTGAAGATKPNISYYIGARNYVGSYMYSNRQYAFASIGDGLSDAEAANFYTAVQAFQVTLGRSIGTQTVSDADAQAFVTNAGIVDQVEANAVNNLVIGLKADSLWTKMKAVYPFVGSSSTSNSYNLKNTAQYQITWYGGVTHSSNGITGNGTNGYGDTFLANNVMAQNDAHISLYSRTNFIGTNCDIGSWNGGFGSFIYTRNGPTGSFETTINSTNRISQANADSRGFYLVTRKSGTSQTGQKNTTQYVTATASTNHITTSFKLLRPGEYNGEYSPRNLAFASIGDGLTDAEALNLNTRVTTFQTALNRNV